MIPDNKLSSQPVLSAWLYPYPTLYEDLVDYEMGGVALGDTTQGLDKSLWKLAYDKATSELRLGKMNENSDVLLTLAGINKVTLAFDLNMRACYAVELDNEIQFTYYDSQQNKQITQRFESVRSPYLTLDDRRPENSSNADVILCYVKGDKLCMRVQRDRFLTEYELTTLDVDDAVLQRVGMGKNMRMQFEVLT